VGNIGGIEGFEDWDRRPSTVEFLEKNLEEEFLSLPPYNG
jgi:hypothetical protein